MVNQIVGFYKIFKPKILQYYKHIIELLKDILEFTIYKLLWFENVIVDAKLAKKNAMSKYKLI